jgi:CDP-glycerol glycerophosphotransferase
MEWAKRPETTYLQTWHGTPLKRVHSDVLWAPPGRLNRLDRDIARWDVLLSPNAASTPRLRQAFGYSAEVLESGYPRNDVLLSPDADARRRRVRADLGLDDGTVAVLYTPTWRDDAVFSEAQAPLPIRLQLEELVRQLGPGYTVLVRVHSMETDRHARVERPGVRDVSFHADVAELYLAADAMITDYSSTMFDFAVTGKPLLFYAYDYERFRDEVRGFYFDLEDEAPGPLLPDEDHLAHALRDLDEVRRTHAVEYAAFRRRYCALEDGRATERVLERMWKT